MSNDISDYRFIERLKNLPFVDAIWLFGSRARNDHQDRSDIDLAILCPTASDSEWLKIRDIIDTADTLLNIDCVRCDKGVITATLYDNIVKDKVVIYNKDDRHRQSSNEENE